MKNQQKLGEIVLFGLGLSILVEAFNISVRERFPYPYKKCFVLLPNRGGISQSTLSSPAYITWCSSYSICNSPSPPLADMVFFGFSLKVFELRQPGGGFYTLIKNVLFFSSTGVGSHNPPLRSSAFLLAHRLT